MCFLNILNEAEIDTISKTWGKWISIVREEYGKTQTFQIYGFLKKSQNMGKVIPILREKYGKTQTF